MTDYIIKKVQLTKRVVSDKICHWIISKMNFGHF